MDTYQRYNHLSLTIRGIELLLQLDRITSSEVEQQTFDSLEALTNKTSFHACLTLVGTQQVNSTVVSSTPKRTPRGREPNHGNTEQWCIRFTYLSTGIWQLIGHLTFTYLRTGIDHIGRNWVTWRIYHHDTVGWMMNEVSPFAFLYILIASYWPRCVVLNDERRLLLVVTQVKVRRTIVRKAPRDLNEATIRWTSDVW